VRVPCGEACSPMQGKLSEKPTSRAGQADKHPTGLRSKRKPRAAFSESIFQPLSQMNVNRPPQERQTRRKPKPTGVYFETLEEYVEYMTASGGEKRARHGTSTSMRTFLKRRTERVAKLRAGVSNEDARKALIEAIEARPCKELYRMVGSDEFELLVTGSGAEQKYVPLDDVELQIFVEFAKASRIDHVGVEPWRLRWKIYKALDLELL
jgi:hypothetical protein